MEMPPWAMKRAAEPSGGEQQAFKRVAGVVAGGGSDRDIIRQLAEILVQLSLVNAGELRELCAVTYHTFILPDESCIVTEMRQMGKDYHTKAQEIAKIQNEAERVKAVEQQGPPSLHMWLALLQGINKAQGDQKLGDADMAKLKNYWDNFVLKLELPALSEQVRHCKCKEIKKKKLNKGQSRLTVAVHAEHVEMGQIIKRAILKQHGIKKYGPAPRGPLERGSQRLLDKLKKQ